MKTDYDSLINMNILNEKLHDAETPGFYALFTDAEAAAAGAFEEDAISGEVAFAASYDNPDIA